MLLHSRHQPFVPHARTVFLVRACPRVEACSTASSSSRALKRQDWARCSRMTWLPTRTPPNRDRHDSKAARALLRQQATLCGGGHAVSTDQRCAMRAPVIRGDRNQVGILAEINLAIRHISCRRRPQQRAQRSVNRLSPRLTVIFRIAYR